MKKGAERLNLILPHEGVISPDVFANDLVFDERFNAVLKMLEVMMAEVEDVPLTSERVRQIKSELELGFIAVASDLGTFDLAKGHTERLIEHLLTNGAKTERDLLLGAIKEFYLVAKNILGPLWAAYVDRIMSTGVGGEVYLFAARDATPMYWAAEGLLFSGSDKYNMNDSRLVHVDWNRWFMGQEDELENGTKPLGFDDPMLVQFYEQMGFKSGKMIKIVEPGAWGSAANALKNVMPDQPFELWFMFSHMPDRIYGFLNSETVGIDPKYMEMINDTAEAMPKAYVRPTELVRHNGLVKADISQKVLSSPFIRWCSWAVNDGAFAAGVKHSYKKQLDVQSHIEEIIELSKQSARGVWTGVLPRNTLTWTEGESWRKNWPWGKIPPLK